MIVMIEIILILLFAKFCTSCWNKVEKIISLKLIYEQTISKAEEIYGSLLYDDKKNEVEREILLGIDC